MTNPERYLTVDELRAEVAVRPEAYGLDDSATDDNGDTEFDRRLKEWLDDESERIESAKYAGTRFVQTSTTVTVYGDEAAVGDDLPLPERPIVDVTSIDADGTALEPGVDVEIRETHLVLLDDAPIFSWPDGSIEVTYTYGFDSVPGPVRDGLVRLVRSRLERIMGDGVTSESVPSGQNTTYRPPEQIRADVRASVATYRPETYGSDGAMVI